jgi:saccharopine dehydrogenase-like NADP-dependent oxidoreductase
MLIGRSQAALSGLTKPDAPRPTSVASIDDSAALERALDGCSVLVNCAPTRAAGERLVRAALDAGIHYVDAAGQQRHIRNIFEKYDDEATQCDVAIVPALGFDYAIGDCLAHLAAQSRQPASAVVIAYAIEGSEVTENSARAAATTEGPEVVYRDGGWRGVPFEFDRAWFEFPDPIGRSGASNTGPRDPRHDRGRSGTNALPHSGEPANRHSSAARRSPLHGRR